MVLELFAELIKELQFIIVTIHSNYRGKKIIPDGIEFISITKVLNHLIFFPSGASLKTLISQSYSLLIRAYMCPYVPLCVSLRMSDERSTQSNVPMLRRSNTLYLYGNNPLKLLFAHIVKSSASCEICYFFF